MSRHAAITIISKNYFAFARTLAESYKRHHPEHDFIVVLVDKADGYLPAVLECGAQVVEIAAFQVPDLARMIYRYSIMELNTAVKPFVLADLFKRQHYETLLYIDPDIWILEPLAAVYEGLSRASVVLTPHMRRPYFDDASPSDTAILQSGTYNLGFIGLKRGESSHRLLEWWMTKLYRDCIVDIANGLFVDQKWIDLVPGFFPDHEILYHPGYNAAYWNLHERPITDAGGHWKADGQPLVFFHFSGYVPFAPDVLSKHQNRHQLVELPALKRLTEAYGAALVAQGYEQSHRWPYAFATLPNGVALPLDLVARAMQWASRQGVPTPCPITEPARFCSFLMSRGATLECSRGVLLFEMLLQARGDVAAAFTGAADDHDHPGFRAWLASSGVEDYRLEDLLPFERPDAVTDFVEDAFRLIRSCEDAAAQGSLRTLWSDSRAFEGLLAWIESESGAQAGLGPLHAAAIRSAIPGIEPILHVYFLRADLQVQFPDLQDAAHIDGLVSWLRRHRYALELGNEEVSLFREFALASDELLAKASFLYQHQGRAGRAEPNLYAIDARRNEIGSRLDTSRLTRWLAAEPAIEPLDHFRVRFGSGADALGDFARLTVTGLDAKSNVEFIKKLRQQAAALDAAAPRINLAAFLTAPSGMGESGRSMHSTLRHAGLQVREVVLPSVRSLTNSIPSTPALFGWPHAKADVSIAVANADSASDLERVLPGSFWGRRSIGYWVWETELLPARWRRSLALFHEIWTPSEYSAAAIRRTIDRPVRVLPHAIDTLGIDGASADRKRFGLPERALLFGFAFDPHSVLERKNVRGLVEAFTEAFRDDDNCFLVLKANTAGPSSYEFDCIRSSIESDRVLLVEGVLDREGTFAFYKSLDAYVSLHRAEGFGLTCAEAMACGLPVIASRYSGNLEFMDDQNSLLVKTDVVQTDRPYGPYPAGTRWGQPDHDAAVAALRQLLSRELRQGLGVAASASVRRTLAAHTVSQRLRALLALPAAQGRADHTAASPLSVP